MENSNLQGHNINWKWKVIKGMLCSEFQINAFMSVKLALHLHNLVYYLRKKINTQLLLCSGSGVIAFAGGGFAMVLAPPPYLVAIEVDSLLGLQAGGNLICKREW